MFFSAGGGVQKLNGVSAYFACSVDNHFFYQTCIGDLFKQLLESPPPTCTERIPFSGVLFHHHDMWVNPYKLVDAAQFDRSKMWFPERGLPNDNPQKAGTFCASGAELAADCGWGWCNVNASYPGQPSEQWQALRALERLQLAHWPPGRICRMHSDIFYVPVRFMAGVSRIAWAFNTTFHVCWRVCALRAAHVPHPQEVAVPTILHIALWEAEQRDAFQHTLCNGSCCEPAGAELLNYNCAHRLNLSNRTVREQVVLALLP